MTENYIKRLLAWWNGTDNGGAAKTHARDPAKAADATAAHAAASRRKGPPVWNGSRIELLTKLWGDGNAAPTEKAFFEQMYAQLLLNSSHTVLDVGDGLAGAAVHMAKEYKTYVDSFVSNPDYVEAAKHYVERKGQHNHVTVHPYELEHFHLEKRYDVASVRRSLWRVPDVEEFFITIASHMKEGGRLVIADYIAEPQVMALEATQTWFQKEHFQHGLTLAEINEKLVRAGFEVRVNADLTKEHLKEIRRGLNQLKEFLKGVSLHGETRDMVMYEADRWATRAHLLQEGMQFFRFFAQLKKETPEA